jgi:hypothetical protein
VNDSGAFISIKVAAAGLFAAVQRRDGITSADVS